MSVTAEWAKSIGSVTQRMTFLPRDRPPLKWSNLSNGFAREEDRDAEEELQKPEEIVSKLR
jgi:hypothetical protein